MPETGGSTVEFAQHLSEHGDHGGAESKWHLVVEILEVLLLAIVAVATAYSGWQAAKWDARESLRYGESSTLYTEAATTRTAALQVLAADAATFTAWLQATTEEKPELQGILVARMSPEYRVAFEAWLKTDPLEHVDSAPGPATMPEYRNPLNEKADEINAHADEVFDEGTHAAHDSDSYVRNTVLFAMVLFLVAMAQRFPRHSIRVAMNAIAGVVLVGVLISTANLPHL